MRHLAKLSYQHCADFAFPEFARTKQDLQRLLPKELQSEDTDALTALVKGAATNPQEYGSSPSVEAGLEATVVKINQKYPWAIEVLKTPANHKDDPASLCGATIALYSEILAIPGSSRSGAVLRYMLSE